MIRLTDFLDIIKYEYRYDGITEKNGQQFKRYTKKNRFNSTQKRKLLWLMIFVAGLLFACMAIPRCVVLLEPVYNDSAADDVNPIPN